MQRWLSTQVFKIGLGLYALGLILGCSPRQYDPLPSEEDENEIICSEGDTSARFVNHSLGNNETTPYPVAVYIETSGAAGGTFELFDNQTSVDSGTLPTGNCANQSAQQEIIHILDGNIDHTLRFTVTDSNNVFSDSELTLNVAGRNCISNEDFYNTILSDALANRCSGCHSNSDNSPGWRLNLSGVSEYIDGHGDQFVTEATRTSHGGGRRWDLDDDQALRAFEFVYRIQNQFSCP